MWARKQREAFLWKAVCMVQPQQHKNVEGVAEPPVGSMGLHSVVCPLLFSQRLRVLCFFIFQWTSILIKISTCMWSLCKSSFISFREWDLPLRCCGPLVGIQHPWPALLPPHALSYTTCPWIYSHPGSPSLPVSSMDVSPCSCPLAVGLLPRLSVLLTGWLPRFMFTAVLKWASIRYIYQALFPDFHAHLSHAPRSPHQMRLLPWGHLSLQLAFPLLAFSWISSWWVLFFLSPSPSFRHHPFPPWLLQRPPFWPPVSCLPLALPSAGRISFLKNVCWKHVSGFPRLRTWSGSWMWSTEPHLLRLPVVFSLVSLRCPPPLCARLLCKQHHSPLLLLQASLLLCLPLTPNIQVFLSCSLSLT